MISQWFDKHSIPDRDRLFFDLILSQKDYLGAVLDLYTACFDGESGVTLFYNDQVVDYLEDAYWDEVKITHPALVELLTLLGFPTQWSNRYRKGQKP